MPVVPNGVGTSALAAEPRPQQCNYFLCRQRNRRVLTASDTCAVCGKPFGYRGPAKTLVGLAVGAVILVGTFFGYRTMSNAGSSPQADLIAKRAGSPISPLDTSSNAGAGPASGAKAASGANAGAAAVASSMRENTGSAVPRRHTVLLIDGTSRLAGTELEGVQRLTAQLIVQRPDSGIFSVLRIDPSGSAVSVARILGRDNNDQVQTGADQGGVSGIPADTLQHVRSDIASLATAQRRSTRPILDAVYSVSRRDDFGPAIPQRVLILVSDLAHSTPGLSLPADAGLGSGGHASRGPEGGDSLRDVAVRIVQTGACERPAPAQQRLATFWRTRLLSNGATAVEIVPLNAAIGRPEADLGCGQTAAVTVASPVRAPAKHTAVATADRRTPPSAPTGGTIEVEPTGLKPSAGAKTPAARIRSEAETGARSPER